MSDEIKYNCPKCGRGIKSSSGWTLHIKKCCPEHRFRQTTAKMLIEFTVPIALDGTHILSRSQRYHLGGALCESAAYSAEDLFSVAFHCREIPEVGGCKLGPVTLLEKTITTREMTNQEVQRAMKADKDKDKNATISECKRIVNEILGEHEYSTSIETHWPHSINVHLYPSLPNNVRKWQIRNHWICSFTFDLDKHTMKIGQGQVSNSYPKIHEKERTFSLADPECFDQIRKWLKIKK